MKNIHLLILFNFVFILSVNAQNSPADRITGQWYTEENKSVISIFKKGEKYYGKIISLKEPNDEHGQPKTDKENPDEDLQNRPVKGIVFLTDFEYTGDNVWENGKVYDPESGNTYSGKLTLVNKNTIKARGFIGISLIGRTTTWTRKID